MITKRFQKFADDHGFKEIQDYDDDKYYTIKDYPVEIYDKNYLEKNWNQIYRKIKTENDQNLDFNLVFALWQNPIYVKLLYISFLCQLQYTDIDSIDKITFVTDEKLSDLVEDIFGFWIHECEEISIQHIDVNSKELIYSKVANNTLIPRRMNKYIISLFEDVRENDYVLISDCESFPFGKKTSVYENIYKKYKEEDSSPILGCHVNQEKVFLKRREDLAGMMYNDYEYVDWCCRRLRVKRQDFVDEIVNMGEWYLTCWFGFGSEKFNDDLWEEFVEWARAYSLYCDESVYLSYGVAKRNYDVEDLDYINDLRFVHAHNCEKFFRSVLRDNGHDEFGVLHPLHDRYIKDLWVQDFYDHVQENFKQKLPSK